MEKQRFLFLIFPQLEAGMILLEVSEHLFHIRLGKCTKQDGHVDSYRIVTLRKLIKELSWLSGHDTMAGLDRPLAGHHDSQLTGIDRNLLGQEQHITHL